MTDKLKHVGQPVVVEPVNSVSEATFAISQSFASCPTCFSLSVVADLLLTTDKLKHVGQPIVAKLVDSVSEAGLHVSKVARFRSCICIRRVHAAAARMHANHLRRRRLRDTDT